ncbi:hypothetical protein PWT90_08731 [Aphanocladium album]|nr:hypothetical protein PWT90_08731 [Aphanocladium album]
MPFVRTIFVFLATLFVQSSATTVQELWSFPPAPDGAITMYAGNTYKVEWGRDLKGSVKMYCPTCDPENANLWLTNGDDSSIAVLIARGLNLSTTFSTPWKATRPPTKPDSTDSYTFRFISSLENFIKKHEEISSSGFILKDSPKVQTSILPALTFTSTSTSTLATTSTVPSTSDASSMTTVIIGSTHTETTATSTSTTTTSPSHESGLSVAATAGIGAGAGVIAIALFALAFCCYRRKQHHQAHPPSGPYIPMTSIMHHASGSGKGSSRITAPEISGHGSQVGLLAMPTQGNRNVKTTFTKSLPRKPVSTPLHSSANHAIQSASGKAKGSHHTSFLQVNAHHPPFNPFSGSPSTLQVPHPAMHSVSQPRKFSLPSGERVTAYPSATAPKIGNHYPDYLVVAHPAPVNQHASPRAAPNTVPYSPQQAPEMRKQKSGGSMKPNAKASNTGVMITQGTGRSDLQEHAIRGQRTVEPIPISHAPTKQWQAPKQSKPRRRHQEDAAPPQHRQATHGADGHQMGIEKLAHNTKGKSPAHAKAAARGKGVTSPAHTSPRTPSRHTPAANTSRVAAAVGMVEMGRANEKMGAMEEDIKAMEEEMGAMKEDMEELGETMEKGIRERDDDERDDDENNDERDNDKSNDERDDDERDDDESNDDQSVDERDDDKSDDDDGNSDEREGDESNDDERSDDERSDDDGSDEERSDEERSDEERSDEERSDEERSDEERDND